LKDYDLSQVLSRCLHFRAGMVNNFLPPIAHAQGANKPLPETPIKDADADHEEQRSEWFLRGRVVPGKSSAELHRRAYQTKMQQLDWVALVLHSQPRWCCQFPAVGLLSVQFPWLLMLRARGVGTITWSQAAPAIAIDPADSTGNTVYIGGAQGGVWDVNQCNHQRRQQRQLHGAHRRPGYAFERVDRNSIGEFQSPPKCDSGGHRRG
jgi:hypothetical protein